MKKIVMILGTSALVVSSAIAQAPPAPATAPAAAPAPIAAPAGSPVAKQPQLKSMEEQTAWQAFVGAQADPAAMIKAGNAFLTAHPMSDFKPIVLQIMSSMYLQTRDFDNAIITGEKAIAADPQSFASMLTIASAVAESTKEFDLDKAEKIKRVEKMASQALETLKTSPRPNANFTEEQWTAAKRDIGAQAYEALAIAARVDKKYDVAATNFKKYVADSAQPEPRTLLMFAQTYFDLKQWDNCLGILDPIIANAQTHPQIKKVAEDFKASAVKAKAATK